MTDIERLTERQRECLRLLYDRYQIKEIADRLGISPAAVKDHLATARERLGGLPSSMAAARLLAVREGGTDYTSGGPPPKPIHDSQAAAATNVSAETDHLLALNDGTLHAIYRPERATSGLPLPTAEQRTTDLGWRGKLLWGLIIALASVLLVGAAKELLH